MKIKTICYALEATAKFDEEVNAALAEGWQLVKREVLPGMSYTETNWAKRALYAELVKLDPPAEPETTDPFDAVRAIKATCEGVSLEDCHACRCPLSAWCRKMPDGYDPIDWDIPGEVWA